MKSESEVAQSCPTLSDPIDRSLPGSSAHGIFQARVLEWGAIALYSDHLTCLLRKLYDCQEATVRTRAGTIDWFQTSKGLHQSCMLSPCLFNLHAEYNMQNAGLDEAQAGIKIAWRNINNLRYAYDTTLWQKVKN